MKPVVPNFSKFQTKGKTKRDFKELCEKVGKFLAPLLKQMSK